jgi:L-threonylcarbamoyladenylate synthase
MNDIPSTAMPLVTRHLRNDGAGIAEAASILRQGGVVAIPTETVYGLAADATNPLAVAKIYAAKGRPAFNPLIAHCASVEDAMALGHFDDNARTLAQAFWPGPMTLVVPARQDGPVCELARAGLETIAIRVPAHAIAQAIIAATGKPLAAPSANRSGHVSPTSAAHVINDLDGLIDAIVDGGASGIGIESTIIACIEGRMSLLRPGGLAREDIEAVFNIGDGTSGDIGLTRPENVFTNRPIAPGQLDSHYAPRARVILNADSAQQDEAYLAFGPVAACISSVHVYNLSETGDVREAAARLYEGLRFLDKSGAHVIKVACIPDHGLGDAIRDRLERAATA